MASATQLKIEKHMTGIVDLKEAEKSINISLNSYI
jgi:hypothetical protein